MNKSIQPRHLLLLILLTGLIVRIVFFLQLKDTPLAQVPILDCQTYHDWAVNLVKGNWGWNETYWMGPLYPHLLAVIYLVFGSSGQAPLLLQLGLSLLNVWLVFLLARRLTESPADNEWTAVLAAGLFALYGAAVFYAGMLLMATVVTTLYLLVALKTCTAVDRPGLKHWIQLGLLVGLTGLARGNVLLLLAVLPLLLWKAVKLESGRWKLAGALVLSGLVMLAPVTVRNLVVARDFVLLTSNGGVNLLIGQQADYQGIFAPVMERSQAEFDPSMETNLERELGRDLKGSEVSRILAGRALDEFRSNFSAMPMHYLRKAYRFWNGYELPQIVSYDHWRTRFSALFPLVVPFTLLSALGLLGFRFLSPGRRWVMLILVGAYFLSLLPFFPTSRYRQPIVPLLAVNSAIFLTAMIRGSRRSCRLYLAAAAMMILALLPRWADLDNDEVEWQVHLHEASRASKLGDLAGTLEYGKQAEAARPGLADTPYHLSLYLEDLGARGEALKALQVARTRAPENRLIPYRMGRNLEELQQLEAAAASFQQAARLDPGWAYPQLRLGLVYRQLGQPDLALAALQKAHQLGPGQHRVRANLASAYAEAGDLDTARQLLIQLTDDYPLYVNGWFNLALVELRGGHSEAAHAALSQAEKLRGLSEAEKNQISQLRQAVDRVRGS